VVVNERWIATSAIRHFVALLTHNRKHFDGDSAMKVASGEVTIPMEWQAIARGIHHLPP
jgi:hypothetical protein